MTDYFTGRVVPKSICVLCAMEDAFVSVLSGEALSSTLERILIAMRTLFFVVVFVYFSGMEMFFFVNATCCKTQV